MLHLYLSDSLNELFSVLCQKLEEEKTGNSPLQPDHFILPNNDMGRWLQVKLAKERGISANLVLEMPSSYMRTMYRYMNPDYEAKLVEKSSLNWIFYQLLHAYGNKQTELQPVQHFIEAGGNAEQDLRRWQMAERIADIFDQYLIYRPDWISEWSNNRQPEECAGYPHASWQKWLWQQVNREYPEIRTRAGLQADLLKAITSGEMDVVLPNQIFVFGVPVMAPVFVKSMLEIAKRGVQIDWLRIIPSKKATEADSELSNPLSNKLMAECIDTTRLLVEEFQKTQVQVKKTVRFSEQTPQTLLQNVQRDIVSDSYPDEVISLNEDHSLMIHACHNPTREAEIVYDQILDYLNNNPDRGPGDILVMTPDIETYGPVLEAVFGNPGDREKALPFSIGDSSTGIKSEIADLIQQILSTATGRFKITEVMELLDSPLIRNTFRFEREDVTILEKWVSETNIRWGWDEQHHQGEYRNSWRFGLDRMFAGMAYDNDLNHPVNEILPYSEIEGGKSMQLLGRLRKLLEKLNQYRGILSGKYTPVQWKKHLTNLIDTFITEDEQTTVALQSIREKLSELDRVSEQWGVKESVSFTVIQEWLTAVLESVRIGMGFRTGKVTCSAMVPVRNMPFKFIAILGVNDQEIPGSDTFSGFDLMGQIKRKGDRSRRNQDRAIFLDTLLAAEDRLHLSYKGQDQKDNSEIPPSALVTELLEYLDDHYLLTGRKPSEAITLRHSLYGFDAQYFKPDSTTYFSYSELYERTARITEKPVKEVWYPADEALDDLSDDQFEISIDQLIRFLQKPAGEMLRHQLEVRLVQEEVITEDRDPWLLNYLTGYRIRKHLLDALLEDRSTEEVYEYFRAEGIIPRGETGSYRFGHLTGEIEQFVEKLRERGLINEYHDPVEFDHNFTVDGHAIRLYGKLNTLTKSGNVIVLINLLKPKYRLMAWVYHLITQLEVPSDQQKPTVLVMRNKKNDPVILRYTPVENPEEQLMGLLRMYLSGMKSPLGVYPGSSAAFVDSRDKDEAEELSLQKAANEFYGSPFHEFPDAVDDSAINYLFEFYDPLQTETFKKWAAAIWNPIKAHEEKL